MKKGRNIVKNSDLYCELFYGKNSIEVLEELKKELGFDLPNLEKCVIIER
jgi:predicted MPP superfamily phosphohydrolase